MMRNAGVGTRDMRAAGRLLLNKEVTKKALSFQSIASVDQAWRKFANHAHELGIRRLEHITFELVKSYGEELANDVIDEIYSETYAQRLVSAVNTVMHLANRSWRTVKPVVDCGIARRTAVRKHAPSGMDDSDVQAAVQDMRSKGQDEAAAITLLAKALGLRLKEASLINAAKAVRQAAGEGVIRVIDGTKGGRARTVPVLRDDQFAALEEAAVIQGTGRSVMPSELDWQTFREGKVKSARATLKAHGIARYHDLRAAYACQRYEELTGYPAPVVSGRIMDREADRDARAIISRELGHNRISVVAAYVGGLRCIR